MLGCSNKNIYNFDQGSGCQNQQITSSTGNGLQNLYPQCKFNLFQSSQIYQEHFLNCQCIYQQFDTQNDSHTIQPMKNEQQILSEFLINKNLLQSLQYKIWDNKDLESIPQQLIIDDSQKLQQIENRKFQREGKSKGCYQKLQQKNQEKNYIKKNINFQKKSNQILGQNFIFKNMSMKVKSSKCTNIPKHLANLLIKHFQKQSSSEICELSQQKIKSVCNRLKLLEYNPKNKNLLTLQKFLQYDDEITTKYLRRIMIKILQIHGIDQAPKSKRITDKINYLNALKVYKLRCKSSKLVGRMQIK